MNRETNIQHKIMLALSESGCIIWRNNTGSAWQGQTVHTQPGVLTLRDPRLVKFGLCEGSADLIGIHRGTGRFLAFEVKTETGRATVEQKRFINAVCAAGGIAGIVRSPAEAIALVHSATQ
jgi:hypothetical protein